MHFRSITFSGYTETIRILYVSSHFVQHELRFTEIKRRILNMIDFIEPSEFHIEPTVCNPLY